MTKPALFAGTSGWAYATWKPGFYPASVASRRFLEHYAGRLNSVEVNYTFKRTVTPEQLNGWLQATREDFRFSFKAPAAITHVRRLRDCELQFAEFLASLQPVVKGAKQGAVLLQFPPNFRAEAVGKDRRKNSEAFKEFLQCTRETRTASNWQFAVEFRDPSWFAEQTYAVLTLNNVALCTAESDKLNTPQIRTADFSYARLRASEYSASALQQVRHEQLQLATQGTAYAYFKHEDAPDGALRAENLLRARVPEIAR